MLILLICLEMRGLTLHFSLRNFIVIGGTILDCKHWFWVECHKSETVGLDLRHIRVKHFLMIISVLVLNFIL